MTSAWSETRTFFPLFLQALKQDESINTVVVVGAADGKFVIPLVEAGYNVTAVDINGSALYGSIGVARGNVNETYPGDGLIGSIRQTQLESRVTVVNADIRSVDIFRRDALWTSCSWHYSVNHDQPLRVFIDALARCVRPGGLLGAEYFMPLTLTQVRSEYFLEEGEIWRYLPDWEPAWEAYTPPFVEEPHLGQPESHVHRMGFTVARR